MFNPETISIESIIIPEGRRTIDEDTVQTLANSMEKIGLHTPITVRRNDDGKVILVAGAHRHAAASLLGWEKINCFALKCSEDEADMWEIAENLHRADLTVLQRSEQIAKWVEIANRVSAQVAPKPQGGRPEGGERQAARELNIDRDEVRRAVKISKLSIEAKKAAVTAGMDDNQSAMLAAFRAGDKTAQVELIEAHARKIATPSAFPPDENEQALKRLRTFERAWNDLRTPNEKQLALEIIDRSMAA